MLPRVGTDLDSRIRIARSFIAGGRARPIGRLRWLVLLWGMIMMMMTYAILGTEKSIIAFDEWNYVSVIERRLREWHGWSRKPEDESSAEITHVFLGFFFGFEL